MSNGPALFTDFGKKARDLLNKDYTTDQKFMISTSSSAGVNIVSTIVEKGGLSSGDVAAQIKYKNAVADVKLDAELNSITTFVRSDLLPSTKAIASITLPDYNSGKLEFQYLHEHAAFTSGIGLKRNPAVDFSVTVGTLSIAFGAEASYMTSSSEFSKYNAGFNMTKPNSCVSAILADKGDSLRASYLHHLDKLNNGAVLAEISRKFSKNENTLTVGCSYVVDPHTLVKAKLNNHGNLGALIQHEFSPRSFLILSGAFNTKDLEKIPKFGLCLSLKP